MIVLAKCRINKAGQRQEPLLVYIANAMGVAKAATSRILLTYLLTYLPITP